MDIVVLVKQTFDTEAKIELAGDAIVSDGVKKILNPYDEYAVEEAVRLKEKNGGTVTAVGIGGKEFEDVLRHVLAMGCDASVVIDDPAVLAADAAGRAAALAAAVRKLPYDLILCGQTVIDSGTGEVAVRVAEKLGLGEVMTVSKLTLDGDGVTAEREMDGSHITLTGKLPLLLGVDKGINEPRYPGMKSIMQGRKKAKNAQHLDAAALGLSAEDLSPVTQVLGYELPARERIGKIFADEAAPAMVAELAGALHTEAKVI
ncbi:MAG: electron transfer flavoprotein subunit beta/FixA family protein [Selenomonadaceae bacterium]|nr:electron transfer flavoprotein subunit beta/FixA family protein [Selenomonadaceae bacterium]